LPGYCVLLAKDPEARAFSDLPRLERVRFLADAALLAMAVESACREADAALRRTNLEVVGNTDACGPAPVSPRHSWDLTALLRTPVWVRDRGSWSDPATMLGAQHDAMRLSIAEHLSALMATDQVGFTE